VKMPSAHRPLVLGASGLVGSRLADFLETRYPETSSASRVEMDITDRWRVEAELERLRPTVVINAAGMSDVDRCEKEPGLAHSVNASGPERLASACRAARVRLIHLSTDYVFDGEKGAEYDEADPPNPVNEYGRSKLLGEMAILETLVDAIVLRTSFVFGPGRETFIDKIARRALDETGPVEIVDGWVSRPTSTDQICRAIDAMLDTDETGVWHVACPPAGSRLEFSRRVFELLGEDAGRVVPIPPESLELPARRPPATPLATRRFEESFGEVASWIDEAREYLHRHVTTHGE